MDKKDREFMQKVAKMATKALKLSEKNAEALKKKPKTSLEKSDVAGILHSLFSSDEEAEFDKMASQVIDSKGLDGEFRIQLVASDGVDKKKAGQELSKLLGGFADRYKEIKEIKLEFRSLKS